MIMNLLSSSADSGIALLLVALVELLWLRSVVVVARTKTADPLDRIVWLMIVLTLNIVGSVLYLFFVPTSEDDAAEQSKPNRRHLFDDPTGELEAHERELKRRANEGTL